MFWAFVTSRLGIGLIAAGVLAATLGITHLQLTAMRAQLAVAHTQISVAEGLARGWEGSYRAQTTLRGLERRTDLDAATAVAGACEARIATARRSAGAIVQLVTRPPARVPAAADGTCPARETITGAALDASLPSR